jgi:hypothetical protein
LEKETSFESFLERGELAVGWDDHFQKIKLHEDLGLVTDHNLRDFRILAGFWEKTDPRWTVAGETIFLNWWGWMSQLEGNM